MPSMPSQPDGAGFSRRSFLKGASIAAAAGGGAAAVAPERAGGTVRYEPGLHEIELSINGGKRKVAVEPRTTLLDALRDRLDLTGSKKICDRGACGGCTVLIDGLAVNSCMLLALDAVGHEVQTIEGLARGDELHPLQRAFIDCDALQCGFCTPGMIMAGVACLRRHPQPTRAQVQEDLAGNLCRCGTYTRVFEAVEKAARLGGGR